VRAWALVAKALRRIVLPRLSSERHVDGEASGTVKFSVQLLLMVRLFAAG
jgi:hypothetical protein